MNITDVKRYTMTMSIVLLRILLNKIPLSFQCAIIIRLLLLLLYIVINMFRVFADRAKTMWTFK